MGDNATSTLTATQLNLMGALVCGMTEEQVAGIDAEAYWYVRKYIYNIYIYRGTCMSEIWETAFIFPEQFIYFTILNPTFFQGPFWIRIEKSMSKSTDVSERIRNSYP